MQNQTQNKAIITTPTDLEIVITRIFDAPRDLVFKAMTDPTMIPQWWGPAKYKTVIEKLDLRPGGTWRFLQSDNEGNEFAFNGVYREIDPPSRIVQTFEFEGMPGHISVETATLEEENGKTKFTTVSVFQSKEDRDGMLNSGMESGMNEGYERLDQVLANLKAKNNEKSNFIDALLARWFGFRSKW